MGGLADVGGSLPAVLREMGVDVRLALPVHPALRPRIKGQRPSATIGIPGSGGPQTASIYVGRRGRVPLWLIDGPPLRDADRVYHSRPDEDAGKLVFASIAALGYAMHAGWMPQVVHAHDWHTAVALYWLRLNASAGGLLSTSAGVLTIHNLPFLGQDAGAALREYGLPPPGEPDGPPVGPGTPYANVPEWARESLLALGIASAEEIVAVSPSYSHEILTAEYGSGLHGLLQARAGDLHGILNGLDLHLWDPAHDSRLAARFDASRIDRRERNTSALRSSFGLDGDGEHPLAGIVARLDRQKGLDYALPALESWLAAGGQVAVLAAGDVELQRAYVELGERHPGQVGVRIGYDANLAPRIYAGAHVMVIPSRYEPCGLSQMIAMRYGCLPLVRATGGLKDTVRDAESPRGTGIVFDAATPEALAQAFARAMGLFAQPRRWRALQLRAMKKQFGWARSARHYVRVYRHAVRARARTAPVTQEGR